MIVCSSPGSGQQTDAEWTRLVEIQLNDQANPRESYQRYLKHDQPIDAALLWNVEQKTITYHLLLDALLGRAKVYRDRNLTKHYTVEELYLWCRSILVGHVEPPKGATLEERLSLLAQRAHKLFNLTFSVDLVARNQHIDQLLNDLYLTCFNPSTYAVDTLHLPSIVDRLSLDDMERWDLVIRSAGEIQTAQNPESPGAMEVKELLDTLNQTIRDSMPEGYYTPSMETMDRLDITYLFPGVDTVHVVDPETYDLTLTVEERNPDMSEVTYFRFFHLWAYDRETSTLAVAPLGYQPLYGSSSYGSDYGYPLYTYIYPGYRP